MHVSHDIVLEFNEKPGKQPPILVKIIILIIIFLLYLFFRLWFKDLINIWLNIIYLCKFNLSILYYSFE